MNKRFGNLKPFDNAPAEFVLNQKQLHKPLHWKKPRRVFVQSMGDLFHEDVPFMVIAKVFRIMHTSKHHTFMVLTKRPKRMKEFIEWFIGPEWRGAWPQEYPHVWLGVTCENQTRADERIPVLLQIPAAKRFVSVEPMLGTVDLIQAIDVAIEINGEIEVPTVDGIGQWLKWVICGGETGPGARPMHPDWVRSIRDQCRDAGTPFFFKQWGDWAPIPTKDVPVIGCADGGRFHDGPNPSRGLAMYRVGKKAAGYLIDGQEWRKFPEALMR
jgi:protein gp37